MATLFSCEYAFFTLLVQVSPASGMHQARPHKKFTGEPFETFWLAVSESNYQWYTIGFLEFLNRKISYSFSSRNNDAFSSTVRYTYLNFIISKTLFGLDFNLDVNGEIVNLESFKIWQHFFLVITPGTPCRSRLVQPQECTGHDLIRNSQVSLLKHSGQLYLSQTINGI